jgi:hypothetical protein
MDDPISTRLMGERCPPYDLIRQAGAWPTAAVDLGEITTPTGGVSRRFAAG